MNSKLQNEPFFIIGSGRSGTTMLRLMLNEHPRIRIPRETNFIPELIKQFPLNSELSEDDKYLALNLISKHQKWESWATTPQRLEETILSLKQPFLHQLIDAIYHSCSNPENKPRWGDKTILNTLKVELLHQIFPNAKFIHIIRDARDVCASFHKAYLLDPNNPSWKINGQYISNATFHWCKHVNAAIEAGKKLDSNLYLEIKYEDIVLKTEETLKHICKFIEEEYDSKMLSFYKNGAIKEMAVDQPHHEQYHTKTRRPPRPSDTYRWRREMNWIDIALVEAFAGKTMDRVGQIRHFRGWLIVIPYSLRIFDKFKQIFILTSKDYEFITLPNYAHFLYYLLRPIRLLSKYTLIGWKNLLSN